MIRGTTPTIRAKIKSDIELSQMKDIWFTIKSSISERTYKYSEGEVLTEEKEDEQGIMQRRVMVMMSQEDTLSFSAGKVKIQIRFLDASDVAYATKIIEKDMGAILKEGIISG